MIVIVHHYKQIQVLVSYSLVSMSHIFFYYHSVKFQHLLGKTLIISLFLDQLAKGQVNF